MAFETAIGIRVLLVDDHATARAGLRYVLEQQADLCVVAEAGSAAETLERAQSSACTVIVLDLRLPDAQGTDFLALLRQRFPEVAVLVFSGFASKHYGVGALRAGAAGYLTKNASPEELCRAIRVVGRGGRYIGPDLAGLLIERETRACGGPLHESLSPREQQVFRAIAAGQTVTHVAAQLGLTVKTVSTFRSRLLGKMNMRSNADMTYYAIKNGLIE